MKDNIRLQEAGKGGAAPFSVSFKPERAALLQRCTDYNLENAF